MDGAFEDVIKRGGIESAEDYPYEAVNDTCRFKKPKASAHISGFRDVARGNESALKLAVATAGPVAARRRLGRVACSVQRV